MPTWPVSACASGRAPAATGSFKQDRPQAWRMTTGNVATLTAAKARYNGGLRLAPAEKMPLFSIASLVPATLCMISSAAHARVCIRDLKGQIVCGEPVETRDEPNDQAGPRQEDRRDPPSDDQRYRRPGPPYYDELSVLPPPTASAPSLAGLLPVSWPDDLLSQELDGAGRGLQTIPGPVSSTRGKFDSLSAGAADAATVDPAALNSPPLDIRPSSSMICSCPVDRSRISRMLLRLSRAGCELAAETTGPGHHVLLRCAGCALPRWRHRAP